MNPLYHYNVVPPMETFLADNNINTSHLEKYKLSVIYGDADDAKLTKIHDQVYLYPRLREPVVIS